MADDDLSDEIGDAQDESDLQAAAQDGDIARVRQLLADGRSPNGFDEIARTPLHYAAVGGHIEVMRALLDAGADVNAHEEARIGNTALREVAAECSLAVATVLIEAGADPTIPGWMQITALHQAERRKDHEGQRVYALLKRAADRLRDS
jgi:ankyrin repeat protein